ncbi:hypothetical protein [Streptomyces sp. NPDC006368]|uniref:hypothetical protein n=1 Tax=Streptomyces sp. NPDC006368 TaxID=3156760 RepID=UPI00339F8005
MAVRQPPDEPLGDRRGVAAVDDVAALAVPYGVGGAARVARVPRIGAMNVLVRTPRRAVASPAYPRVTGAALTGCTVRNGASASA